MLSRENLYISAVYGLFTLGLLLYYYGLLYLRCSDWLEIYPNCIQRHFVLASPLSPPSPYLWSHQKPKSTTAAMATLEINPELRVDAHLNKVCPATEGAYSDDFYQRFHLVVTALDNVEARRYVDRSVGS